MATIGIEHRARAARERRALAERRRGHDAAVAPDEAHPVRFIGHGVALRPAQHHLMKHPGCRLAAGAWSAGAEDGRLRMQDLGLHKEVAEGRMQGVRGGRGEHDLGVTGDLDHPAGARAVGETHPVQLDVVLRRDDDLGVGLDLVVAAAELGAPLREDRLVAVRLRQRGLIGIRPDLAARRIAQIAELTPGVAGRVFAPAGHGQILPAAVAATGVGHHHVVATVR